MTRRLPCAVLLLALAGSAAADSFTYRGQLQEDGVPANGRYDLQLHFAADRDGKRGLFGPIDLTDVAVSNGQFAASVDLPNLGLASAWLEVAVKPEGETGYWPLGERSEVLLKAAACPASWELGGNAGTLAGTNFLGTTDNQPFEVRTANTRSLRIEPSGVLFNGASNTSNVIGGSNANVVDVGVRGAVIAGGGTPSGDSEPDTNVEAPNRITDHYGFIGSGFGNQSGNASGTPIDAAFATVTGGRGNTASGLTSAVGGGSQNLASGGSSVIAGGSNNVATGFLAAITGGGFNHATGSLAAIGGGNSNRAVGENSVVPGGIGNCAGGDGSFAGGSGAKVVPANNPGPSGACSGLSGYSGVAHHGTFVWADSQGTGFQSSGSDQFLIRSQGGVGLNAVPIRDDVELSITSDADDGDFANLFLRQRTNTAGILISAGGASGTAANNAGFFIDHFNSAGAQGRRVELLGNGVTTIRSNITGANSGVSMAANAGSWSSLSDRRLKTAIAAIDPVSVLERLVAIPINEWSYIAQGNGIRHLGPMAQDFAAAFNLGENNTTISTIDADGVALAAIQGLNAKLERENMQLRQEQQRLLAQAAAAEARDAALQATLDELLTRLAAMESRQER